MAVGLRVDLVTGYVVVGFPVGNLVLGFADVGFALLDVADTGFEVGNLVIGLAVTGMA